MTAGLERDVVDASSGGMSIDDIDRSVIQPAAVSDERKAALWLLAWSVLPGAVARSHAIALLDGTAGGYFGNVRE